MPKARWRKDTSINMMFTKVVVQSKFTLYIIQIEQYNHIM